MTETTWDAALTRVERQLQATEAALAADEEVPHVDWSAPLDLGPMPPSVAPRARALLERTEEVRAVVSQRMTRLSSELGALQHRRGALTAYVTADGDGTTTHTA